MKNGPFHTTQAGRKSADFIDGKAGNDYIRGDGGADLIFGGANDDALSGCAWGDIIIADGNSGGLLNGLGTGGTAPLIGGSTSRKQGNGTQKIFCNVSIATLSCELCCISASTHRCIGNIDSRPG